MAQSVTSRLRKRDAIRKAPRSLVRRHTGAKEKFNGPLTQPGRGHGLKPRSVWVRIPGGLPYGLLLQPAERMVLETIQSQFESEVDYQVALAQRQRQ